jgi:hypothetical protein
MKLIGLALNRVSHVSRPIGPAITFLSVDDVIQHSAQISYAAGPVGATIYFYVSQSAMPPSEADLVAGTGADWSGSQGISNTPSGTPGPSGLTGNTDYYLHALVDDNDRSGISTVSFTTAEPDVQAPVLSDQGFMVLDETSADLNVTTDEVNGLLYVVVTTTQGTPSATQMRAGEDSTGTAGAYTNGGQAVSTTGEQSISATGLSEVAHYAYFMQDDAAGNASNILEAGSFTPGDVTAPVVSSVELVETGTTTATVTFNTDTDEGTGYVIVQPTGDTAPTQAQVVAGSVGTVQGSLAISAIGPQILEIEGLSQNTGYLTYVVHRDASGNDSHVEVAPEETVTESDVAISWTSDGNHDTFSTTDGSFTATGSADAYSNAYVEGQSGDTINVQLVFGAGTIAGAVDVALSNITNARTSLERIDPSGGGTFNIAFTVGSGNSPYSIMIKTYGSLVELDSAEIVPPAGELVFTDELADGAETPVALTSPSITTPYVFQRGRNTVTMSGTFDVTGGNVTGMAWRVADGNWVAFEDEVIDNGAGTWEGTLATPSDYLKQGDLQIKPVNGLNVTPATIADVAVTAVIIASGQSNVDDASVDATQDYTPGAFDYYQRETTGAWTKTASDMTMWPALAEELQAAGIPPAIYLPVDSPGTGYNDGVWVRDTGLLYDQFVDRVTGVTNQTGGVELNLRIQGEKETGSATDAPIWDDYFEDMRDGFVTEIPNMLATDPWFIGITYRSNPYLDDVQAAQMRVIDENAWAYELLNVIGETFGDGVHYGSTSAGVTLAEAEAQMVRLAGRMYRNISPILLGTGTPPGSPVVAGYTVDGNAVTVTFDRAMTNHDDADGWSVTDNSGTRTVVSTAQGATSAQVVLTLDQETYGDVLVSFAKGTLAPNSTLRDTDTNYFAPRPIIDDLAGIGVGVAPTADTAPTLSGIPQASGELTGTDGTYSGIPDPTVSGYQWQASDDGSTGWTDISGATSANYTLVVADENKYVRRQETATSATGSVTQATVASGQIAAASAFTDPSDLTATVEWWDASDAASITTGPNDGVSVWESQIGGTDLAQPSQSFRPTNGTRTINGLNAIYFDGNATDFDGFTRPSYLPGFEFRSGNSSTFYGRLDLLSAGGDAVGSAVDRSAAGLWEIEFDAAANTSTLRYNGAQIGQATNYTGTETGHIFMIMQVESVDNANDRALYAGGTVNVGGASQFINGSIGEIVFCDTVISGPDLTDIRTYFTNKWGAP